MKILVIGGTGKTGKHIIDQALQQGHMVSALVRRPKAPRNTHPNLKIIKGDILNRAQVISAVEGQEAVLSALGHKKFFIKTSILSNGTANLINAMEIHNLKRLICISALGINDSRYRLGLYYTLFVVPVLLYFYFRDKAKQENLIFGSGLEWTIIRPAQLTNGKKRETYKHGPNLGSYILTKMVSRADVAHFMVQQLNNSQNLHKAVGIHY